MRGRFDTSFLCPVNLESLKIQGNLSSDSFKYVKIYIKACVDRPDCKTRKDILTLPEVGTNLVMLKAQPDIFKRDRDTVLTYNTEVTKHYMIDPTTSQEENLFFYESEVLLKDQWYDLFDVMSEYSLKFFETSYNQNTQRYIPEDTPAEFTEYIKIYFRADSKSKQYKREDYQLLDYLGDLGGLLDFVILFCWAMSHVFVKRLFHAALVTAVYRLQKFLLDNTPYYKTKVRLQVSDSSSSHSDSSSSFSDESSSESIDSSKKS